MESSGKLHKKWAQTKGKGLGNWNFTPFGVFSESSLLVNALPSPTTEGCMHFNELFIICQARSLRMTNEYRWLFLLREKTRGSWSQMSQFAFTDKNKWGSKKKKSGESNIQNCKPWSTGMGFIPYLLGIGAGSGGGVCGLQTGVTSRSLVTSSCPLGPQNSGSFHRKTSFQVILGLNPSFNHLRSFFLNL